LTGGVDYQSSEMNDPKWEIFSFPDLTEKSFLEISCNTGLFLKKAKDHGASKIYGIDISWQVLDVAKDKVKDAVLFLSKIEDFDLNQIGKVDYVLCSSAFHYFTNREDVIKRISEITDYFVLETPVIPEYDIIYRSFGDVSDFCAIPGKELLLKWLMKYFSSVDIIGYTEMEDAAPRPVFCCKK
jgi:SAM-dependent methyltransferase